MSAFPPPAIIPGILPVEKVAAIRRQSSARVGRVAAWLLPSFGVMIFVSLLFNVLLLSGGTVTLFRDADTGWHIRTGEGILRNATVPATDSYSLLHGGRQWFAWEWLADVMLGGAQILAGPAGVALLAALCIALVGWGTWRFSLALGADLFVALVALVPMMGTTTIHWLARPHIFSWLLGLTFIAIAERFRTGAASSRTLWLLPALSCLWANVHGSFLLGPALLLVFATGEWLSGSDHAKAGRNFVLAALASLLATLVNPFGWHVHQHIFAYLRNSYLMDHISEFRSFSFHAPGALYVELFLMLAAAGTFLLFRQKAYGPGLLSLALMHMALYSARHLPTYAVLMTPLFCAAISRELRLQPRFARLSGYSERLLAMDRKVVGAVPAALAVVLLLVVLQQQARAGAVGFDRHKFPVAAANFLAGHDAPARRIFARDYWGGYLISRFEGRVKVFVDGRSDFYGEDWLETYAQINEVKPGWDKLLDAFQLDTVLVPPSHPLASALRARSGWRTAYADAVAVVFERMPS
jgi:hypothetical protein